MPERSGKLTRKEKNFVLEYIRNAGQAGQAYQVIYESFDSQELAEELGKALLKDELVKAFLHKQLAILHADNVTTGALITQHLDILKGFKRLSKLLLLRNPSEKQVADIERLQKTYKASDYRNALKEIGLLKGLYITKTEHTSTKVFQIAPTAMAPKPMINSGAIEIKAEKGLLMSNKSTTPNLPDISSDKSDNIGVEKQPILSVYKPKED